MILLTSTNDKLQVITGQSAAIDVHASWVDLSGTDVSPGRTNTPITTASITDVVAAPASLTSRNVQTLHIRNRSDAIVDTTVRHTDGTNHMELVKRALLPGDALQYVDGAGFLLVRQTLDGSTIEPDVTLVGGWNGISLNAVTVEPRGGSMSMATFDDRSRGLLEEILIELKTLNKATEQAASAA